MADPKQIGPQDQQLKLLAAETQTASTNGAALAVADSGFAPPEGGVPMQAQIEVASVKLSAGSETYAFKVQDSPDGATWTDRSPSVTAAGAGLVTDGVGGVITIPFFCANYQVRLVTTLGGTAPSIQFNDSFVSPFTNNLG